MNRVRISPELLRWARERSGRSAESLAKKFPKLDEWERGHPLPTFKQLEDYAQYTHTPFGFFFLPEPPEEHVPIPDLRQVRNQELKRPSADLLDTIYLMQRRQAWLREDRLECEAEPLDFVGSASLSDSPDDIGREMRRIVGLDEGWVAGVRTWEDAVRELRRTIEHLGVMAVINGVVGNDTHRTLNVEEFRGFALCDEYAPLIFVNGADAKSAQMFTLAHELGHIWLGESALTDLGPASSPTQKIEAWCDRAAAEFLVPAQALKVYWSEIRHESRLFEIMARHFKVSPIVAGRRAMDLRLVDRETFFTFYQEYITRERKRTKAPGGDFYSNQNTRVGKMFARQVIYAAMEGRLGFKEAYDLTGLHGGAFQEYALRLGISLP